MAVFYKYEYMGITKNIHPCDLGKQKGSYSQYAPAAFSKVDKF